MIIRQGFPDDCNNLYELETRAFPNTPWSFEMVNEELKLIFDRKTWISEEDDSIVGYCMVRFGPNEAHLINMAVCPLHRQKGIASKLLNHFLGNIPKKTSVFLEVKEGNFPAINLYEKHNFVQIGIRKKYYTDGKDAIVMFWCKEEE